MAGRPRIRTVAFLEKSDPEFSRIPGLSLHPSILWEPSAAPAFLEKCGPDVSRRPGAQSDRPDQSRSSSLIPVLERARSSTRFTITAQ